MRVIIVLAFACSLAGCASLAGPSSSGRAEVTGLNDPLETLVTVETQSYDQTWGQWGGGGVNPFLRAIMAKRQGTATPLDTLGALDGGVAYQLYVKTNARDWMGWSSVRYLVGSGVRTARAAVVATDVSCSSAARGGAPCAHYEDAVAMIPRADLDELARAGSPATFRLQSGRTSEHGDLVISPAEISSFLAAADSARAAVAANR